jgi:hypothetical protein
MMLGLEPVDVLVMLIGAQPVQAGLRRMKHLVQRGVVVLADLVGIGDVEPDRIDMGRVVPPLEIAGQVAIGHQMEHADLHGITSSSGSVGQDATLRALAAQPIADLLSCTIVPRGDGCSSWFNGSG